MSATDRKRFADAELDRLRNGYLALFGEVPPLPAAAFDFSGTVDPEFWVGLQQLRAQAFAADVFSPKVTQLMLFAALLAIGADAARWHALAARRAGASWDELQRVVALVTAATALERANVGGALLQTLRTADQPDAGLAEGAERPS